jgi:hypothetical protein
MVPEFGALGLWMFPQLLLISNLTRCTGSIRVMQNRD